MAAHRLLASFEDRGEGSFGHWLAKIAATKAGEARRHHQGAAKRRVSAEVSQGMRPATAAAKAVQPSPSDVAIAAETRAALEVALARLPTDQREALRLLREEHLTLAQAAERMGRTRDSIKGLQSRALTQLAAEMSLGRSEHRGE